MSAADLSRPPSPSAPAGARAAAQDALPPGTRFGEFEIIRVVGVGGFGIVYLAHDHTLERRVALKEYMPAALASRGDGRSLTLRTGPSVAETYAIGLRSFMNEARLLARFDHPSLVKVYRFWEENATAYMVMPFLQGITLRDARRAMARSPDERWIRSVVDPVLEALELLHRQGVYHRDIAPDNIMLPSEGPPILLDFGAARRVIGDRTQSLTAILKPSYAPIEQYAEMSSMRQGPWTDLYALGAVVHYLLFNAPPEPATARVLTNGSLAAMAGGRQLPGVSARMLATVAWMLAVRPGERPQDVATVRAALDGEIDLPVAAPTSADPGVASTVDAAPEPPRRIHRGWPKGRVGWFAAGGAAAALLIGVVLLWQFVDLLVAGRHSVIAPMLTSARPGLASASGASALGTAPATTALTGSARAGSSSAAAARADGLASAASVVPATATVSASVGTGALSGATVDTGRRVSVAASASLIAPAAAGSGPARLRTPRPVRGDTGLASAGVDQIGGARAATDDRSSAPTGDVAAGPARAALPAPAGAEPASARAACGSRVFIALALCMERECDVPRYRGDPECVSVLEIRRNRESRNQ